MDTRTWVIVGVAEVICVVALILAAFVGGAVGANTPAHGHGGSVPSVGVADVEARRYR